MSDSSLLLPRDLQEPYQRGKKVHRLPGGSEAALGCDLGTGLDTSSCCRVWEGLGWTGAGCSQGGQRQLWLMDFSPGSPSLVPTLSQGISEDAQFETLKSVL
jgi:hypothetical protein